MLEGTQKKRPFFIFLRQSPEACGHRENRIKSINSQRWAKQPMCVCMYVFWSPDGSGPSWKIAQLVPDLDYLSGPESGLSLDLG